MTNTSQLTITQLASTINAHTGKAEHYADKAEQHYKAAGLHLIEAKKRIAAGEYEGGFVKFLKDECRALSSSRAYELIAIANGSKTVETMRADKAASMQRSRKTVRHVVDTAAPAPENEKAVAIGLDSWRKIVGRKQAERTNWHDIGAALCEGWKAHPNTKDFNAWRAKFGFSDIDAKTCDSLMFAAEHADILERLREGLDHPTEAGRAFVDAVNAAAERGKD